VTSADKSGDTVQKLNPWLGSSSSKRAVQRGSAPAHAAVAVVGEVREPHYVVKCSETDYTCEPSFLS